jgi:hypothetical protein
MARINNAPRKPKNIGKLPGARNRGKLSRKLNKLNFLLILGLYALELDLFNQKTWQEAKTYTVIAWDYVISLF